MYDVSLLEKSQAAKKIIGDIQLFLITDSHNELVYVVHGHKNDPQNEQLFLLPGKWHSLHCPIFPVSLTHLHVHVHPCSRVWFILAQNSVHAQTQLIFSCYGKPGL